MAYEIGDNTGYEEEILDLIDKGGTKDRPGIMGAHLMSAHLMGREIIDGEDVQIVAGPRTNAATLGMDDFVDGLSWSDPAKARDLVDQLKKAVQGPKTLANVQTAASINRQLSALVLDKRMKKGLSDQAATYESMVKRGEVLGADASDVAAVALGIPLAAAAGYGIYKAGSALADSSGPSRPWLYKMSPAYWVKSDREKKFIKAEKNASVEDIQKRNELALAERAYRATEAVRNKESEIQKYEAGLEGKGMPAAAPAAPEGGAVVGEDANRDAAILNALKKSGVPITANSFLGPQEMMKATNIVARATGSAANAKSWLTSYMGRQRISYGGGDGSIYEIQGGKPTMVTPPNVPGDVSARTNASGASPWEKGLSDPTARSLKMSTVMPTTGVRGAASPWEKSTMNPTARSLAMSTMMPTTGVRGASPWEKGLSDPTARSLKMSTIMPTTGVRGTSPWEKGLSDPTARSLKMSTVMPTTGVRGAASPWEKGLANPTARSLAMSTVDPTTGARTSSVGAGPAISPQEAQLLNGVVSVHGGTIAQISNAKNLGMKKRWSAGDVDSVATLLLQKMMADTGGRAPSAQDANVARAAVRFWLQKAGGSVAGEFVGVGLFVGNDDVGGFWSGLKTVALSPFTASYWLGKKAVQGVAWTGRKIFGGGSKPNASQQRQAALAAAAKQRAAAQLRIAAAEKRQEAALMEKEQARDVADQQAAAMEAEAAAQAAESVAIEAEAMKDVPDQPASLSGWVAIGRCNPSRVGKAALAAATPTPVGRRLRIGAFVGRAMKKDPVVRAQVAQVVRSAKAGDPKAKRQVSTIKAGIIADKQKLAAVKTNAMVARTVASHEKRKLIALGVSPIGMFSRVCLPKLLSKKPWSPFSFGNEVVGAFNFQGGVGAFNFQGSNVVGADKGKAKASPKGKPTASNVPPSIPGVPPDILVALTASANTLGVPPAVAASVVAAAKSGDPKARQELNEAARVYKAAQKGDPVARKQLAAVAADMKSGYAPAAQKAAVLSAAIGTTKGAANFKRRKVQAARQHAMATAHLPPQMTPVAACAGKAAWMCPISFGRTLWS